MRPIKFRAWDGKKMSQPFFLHELEGYEGECNAVVHNEGDGEDWYQWTIAENGMPSKNTVILQFTGLKDKNGKEIFESYIIRFVEDKEDWFNQIGFEDGSFVRFFDDGTSTPINQKSMSQAVIIGNIYENPELK